MKDESLTQSTLEGSAISTAKAQNRRKRLLSTQEDTAADARNLPEAKSSPVPPENKFLQAQPQNRNLGVRLSPRREKQEG
jgi:hypothetical protein